MDSTDAILKTPLSTKGLTQRAEFLGNIASINHATGFGTINHYNIQPVFDIYANVQSRDLGGVSQDVQKILDQYKTRMKPGNQIILRGLVENMDSAFLKLGIGFLGRSFWCTCSWS